MRILNITGQDGEVITVALNVPSNKHNKKDIIKVENKYLREEDTNKLALVAPRATINIVRDYRLVEKRKIQLPDAIMGIFKCPNLRCVTNGENVLSVIEILDKNTILLRCKYCSQTLTTNDLIF